jgi:hypothetical protein
MGLSRTDDAAPWYVQLAARLRFPVLFPSCLPRQTHQLPIGGSVVPPPVDHHPLSRLYNSRSPQSGITKRSEDIVGVGRGSSAGFASPKVSATVHLVLDTGINKADIQSQQTHT